MEWQVAAELGKYEIPVILTHNRGGPEQFQYRDALVGPPLTKSAPSILADANVTFAIAIDDPGILTKMFTNHSSTDEIQQKVTPIFIPLPKRLVTPGNLPAYPVRGRLRSFRPTSTPFWASKETTIWLSGKAILLSTEPQSLRPLTENEATSKAAGRQHSSLWLTLDRELWGASCGHGYIKELVCMERLAPASST
jgi:hypothetical protein